MIDMPAIRAAQQVLAKARAAGKIYVNLEGQL